MKWQSAYWRCKGKIHLNDDIYEKCDEPLTITLDLGPPVEIVEGHVRVPTLYAIGCQKCQYTKNVRLMLINPWTDDTEIGDLRKQGGNK